MSSRSSTEQGVGAVAASARETAPRGGSRGDGALDLRRYLTVLLQRWSLIAAVVAAALAVAAAATLRSSPRWTAAAVMTVEPGAAVSGGVVRADDLAYLDRLINTYRELVSSDRFAETVAGEIRLDQDPELDVADVPSTNLMEIRARTTDPATAAPAANTAASLLIKSVRRAAAADAQAAELALTRRTDRLEARVARAGAELEELRGAPASPTNRERALLLTEEIRGARLSLTALRNSFEASRAGRDARAAAVSVATPASPPSSADGRNLPMALALGLVLGIVGGVGLAFVLENLSPRFRSGDEIEEWVQAPVLAAIPGASRISSSPTLNGASPLQEGFRRLRVALLARCGDRLPTVLVASAERGDGKSTVVANLGAGLAQAGRRVLLVDADFHRPALHRLLGTPEQPGLGDLLSDEAAMDRAGDLCVATGTPRLFVLPVGTRMDDPSTLLGSPVMGQLVKTLSRRFDCVLLDSPAILAVSDALAIVQHVDSALLVAGADTTRDAVSLADRELRRVGASVLGVVVNRARDPGFYPYLGYDVSGSAEGPLHARLHFPRVGR